MKASVDFSKKAGIIKPVNGVSNGPICHDRDLSAFFKDLNVSSVRYHDTDGSGPYGRYMVDVSRVFPCFDADETDEKNYHFAHTDRLIKAALDCGAEVIYRLGESIDHSCEKVYARPPKDFDKWCRICLQIIKHYNDGWANGYRFGLKYWEIWNEPEGRSANGQQPMWDGGTFKQMLELYEKISTAIKKYDSSLKVGGLSFMYCNYGTDEWLDYCQKHKLPVDFISFHHYCTDFDWIVEQGKTVREMKRKYGFENAEVIIAEWSVLYLDEDYKGIYWDFIGDPINNTELYKKLFINQSNEIGASFVTGFLICMNDLPINKGIFYDFDPSSVWCSLFSRFYEPTKTYYAFKNYGDLLKNSEYRASAEIDKGKIIASMGKNTAEILISNFRGAKEDLEIDCRGLESFRKVTVYTINKDVTNAKIFEGKIERGKINFTIPCDANETLRLVCER